MGLRSEQLSVVQPEGLTRAAFHREARQWQQRRPRRAWRQSLAQLALGTVAGLITGGLASTVAYLTLAAPDTGLDAWSWLQPGLWAGAVAGAVASSVFLRQPRHRFDQTVARKLRQGFCVVVAHGLSPADEASVLACIQDTSHSWCAEAPQRPQRL
jgi:hypothetical protein